MENNQKLIVTPVENDIPPPNLLPMTNPDVQYTSFIPVQTGDVSTQTTPRKQKGHPTLERLINQLKIILKLAKIDAYDTNLKIKNEFGSYIENSNIINLLHNATVPSKVLLGQDAFIALLFKAKVEPELISNENIKTKLIRIYENQSNIENIEPEVYSNIQNTNSQNIDINPTIRRDKRSLENSDDEESEEPPRKREKWIYPNNYIENESQPE
jgi:hypothetical protein